MLVVLGWILKCQGPKWHLGLDDYCLSKSVPLAPNAPLRVCPLDEALPRLRFVRGVSAFYDEDLRWEITVEEVQEHDAKLDASKAAEVPLWCGGVVGVVG